MVKILALLALPFNFSPLSLKPWTFTVNFVYDRRLTSVSSTLNGCINLRLTIKPIEILSLYQRFLSGWHITGGVVVLVEFNVLAMRLRIRYVPIIKVSLYYFLIINYFYRKPTKCLRNQ